MLFWKWILRNLTIVFCNFFKTRTHVIIAQIFSCLLFIPRVRPYQLAPVSTAEQSVFQLNYLSLWFQISISICVKIIAINHKPDQITQTMINKSYRSPIYWRWIFLAAMVESRNTDVTLTKVTIGVQLSTFISWWKLEKFRQNDPVQVKSCYSI